MTIVEAISTLDSIPGGYATDTITLSWEDRRRGHGRRRSDAGVEFAISLPWGAVLKEGDALVLDGERMVVIVREALEPVYVVRPGNPQEWAYYAYQVGNRHQPVMIGDTELVFPKNPAVRSLLEQLRVSFEDGERPFHAALVDAGHGH